MPTLKQLRYFEAVARLGRFGEAAQQCAVTQPALSMQIAALEEELGAVLLERRRGGAEMTEAGRIVAERARAILLDVRDLADAARVDAAPLSGRLRLGSIPTIAPYLLPGLLSEAARRHPELELRIRETRTETLVAELLAGELDVLIIALPAEHAELESRALFDDPFVIAAQRGSAVARVGEGATPALLDGERVLLLEEGHCLRDQALAMCGGTGAEGVEPFGASSLSTLARLAAHGLGVTLLPELAVQVEGREPGLSLTRFAAPAPRRRVGAVWRKGSPRRAEFRLFADLVAEAAPLPRSDGDMTALGD